jgi:hypothetical protein
VLTIDEDPMDWCARSVAVAVESVVDAHATVVPVRSTYELRVGIIGIIDYRYVD